MLLELDGFLLKVGQLARRELDCEFGSWTDFQDELLGLVERSVSASRLEDGVGGRTLEQAA